MVKLLHQASSSYFRKEKDDGKHPVTQALGPNLESLRLPAQPALHSHTRGHHLALTGRDHQPLAADRRDPARAVLAEYQRPAAVLGPSSGRASQLRLVDLHSWLRRFLRHRAHLPIRRVNPTARPGYHRRGPTCDLRR